MKTVRNNVDTAMTRSEVVKLMESSKTPEEWDYNCDKVKKVFGDYPEYWFLAIIAGGVIGRVTSKF